jgi:hypothetical protein
MRDKGSCTPREGADVRLEVAEIQRRADWSILTLMLHPSEHDGLWSMAELERQLEDPIEAQDAVGRLYRDGLVGRCGDHVFPTKAASRFDQLIR